MKIDKNMKLNLEESKNLAKFGNNINKLSKRIIAVKSAFDMIKRLESGKETILSHPISGVYLDLEAETFDRILGTLVPDYDLRGTKGKIVNDPKFGEMILRSYPPIKKPDTSDDEVFEDESEFVSYHGLDEYYNIISNECDIEEEAKDLLRQTSKIVTLTVGKLFLGELCEMITDVCQISDEYNLTNKDDYTFIVTIPIYEIFEEVKINPMDEIFALLTACYGDFLKIVLEEGTKKSGGFFLNPEPMEKYEHYNDTYPNILISLK